MVLGKADPFVLTAKKNITHFRWLYLIRKGHAFKENYYVLDFNPEDTNSRNF